MGSFLHNNQVFAVMIGGGFLFLAAVLTQFVRETPLATEQLERVIEERGHAPHAHAARDAARLVVTEIQWPALFSGRLCGLV